MFWRVVAKFLVLLAVVNASIRIAFAQHLSSADRERAQSMLENVASDIRKYYYDPKLHGVDWDAKVAEARMRIAASDSMETAILQIAALLEVLQDSHTKFVPPRDPIAQEYGWRSQMVGDRCFITHVQPKNDAEGKGLRAGDELLTIDGFRPTREFLAAMGYVFDVLVPRSRVQLDFREPSGQVKHAVVNAKVRQVTAIMDLGDLTGRDSWRMRLEAEDKQRLMRPRYSELGDGLMILKLPTFFPSDISFDALISKARKHAALILDLRGNPGGAELGLQELLGGMFEKDVKIADRVTRDATKPLIAKGSQKGFTGKLIALVDSGSASASELFARVVQIEKRGTVLGDRTAGSVMEAEFHGHQSRTSLVFHYGASISEADLIMTDGKSLEHSGVIPDEVVLPTVSDLTDNRDPILAHAADLAGFSLTPEKAATLFPYEWPRP